jgi:hypothetical protein
VTSRRFSARHCAPTDLMATSSCLIRAGTIRDAALDDADRRQARREASVSSLGEQPMGVLGRRCRRMRVNAVLASGVEDPCLKAIR